MPGGARSIRSCITRRSCPRDSTPLELPATAGRTARRWPRAYALTHVPRSRAAASSSRTVRFARPAGHVRRRHRRTAVRSTSPSECAGSVDSSSTRAARSAAARIAAAAAHSRLADAALAAEEQQPDVSVGDPSDASGTAVRSRPSVLATAAPARRPRERGDAVAVDAAPRRCRASARTPRGSRDRAPQSADAQGSRGTRPLQCARWRAARSAAPRVAPSARAIRRRRDPVDDDVRRRRMPARRSAAMPSAVSSTAIGSGSVTHDTCTRAGSRSSVASIAARRDRSPSMSASAASGVQPPAQRLDHDRCLACMHRTRCARRSSSVPGMASMRSVWPVGAVSTTTRS